MSLWPYSTTDEVSHLACVEVDVLRARIDQLLEERRELHATLKLETCRPPRAWGLSPGEERVVDELMGTHPGKVVTKERLLKAYSGDNDVSEKTVDVVVCKLRKKLRLHLGGEDVVETVWGRGYTVNPRLRAAVGLS